MDCLFIFCLYLQVTGRQCLVEEEGTELSHSLNGFFKFCHNFNFQTFLKYAISRTENLN